MCEDLHGKQDVEENEAQDLTLWGSNRLRRPPVRFHDMATVAVDDPITYKEAMKSAASENWKPTMKVELYAIMQDGSQA